MSQTPDARQMLVEAERAAGAGDFATADRLLREVAGIQEAELGPNHPDLASTLNNLAIVAENSDRWADAEAFYRRAATIAATSLPADHPMVTASRRNLEDFCHARGLPVDRPVVVPVAPLIDDRPLAIERNTAAAAAPAESPQAARTFAPSEPDITPSPSRAQTTVAAPVPPAAPQSRRLAWIAVGAVAVVIVGILAMRPWSSSQEPASAPSAGALDTAAPRPAPSATEPPAPTTASAPPQPPSPAPPPERRAPTVDTSRAPARLSAAVTLATVELCRSFSTSGSNWRCEPAGDAVAPGSLVLYTRVKAAEDAAIVHRWYRGDTLRQSVTLRIRANPTDGYRTYSRQTVADPGDWRVEVRSASGDRLHEQRFAVR